MASVAQLVSEFAHTLGEPNNFGLRQHIKLVIAQHVMKLYVEVLRIMAMLIEF